MINPMRATVLSAKSAARVSSLSLTLVLFAALSTATGAAEIDVGMTLELPPQGFVGPDGQPRGFEYDMLIAAADKMGHSVNIVVTPFEQAFVALSANKYQMFVGGIYIRCERLDGTEATLAFSVPIYEEDQVITTTNENAEKIQNLSDLDGMKLAIEGKGTTADAVSEAFLEQNPDVEFERHHYKNVTDAVLALKQGRDDSMLQARIVTLDAIKNEPNLQVTAAVPDTGYPVGFVFRPGDPLKDEFNAALNELKKDGTLAAIWREWFSVDPADGSATITVVPEVTLDTCKTSG